MSETVAPSLSQALWARNADRATEALGHPFVRRLADGTLPRTSFAHFVAQDAFFLEAFCRAYGFGIAHSPDRMALDTFSELLIGVREELQLHASYAAEWGIDLSTVRPVPATLAYTDFLQTIAARGDIGVSCAALTPCMRLYAHLGQSLSPPASDTYARWIATYADPEFESLAATIERLVDVYADDTAEVRTVYGRAMQLELQFFDAGVTGPER
ncbi:TenA family protein [uncultured Nocardioides sp.]|uniref:TenA family protein n=1 Tax=uncultured Nocardioides sp. TaxID=198441 RepID=UPI0025D5A200|nr:TenA family protein [uncultured Nocardioides sp.]